MLNPRLLVLSSTILTCLLYISCSGPAESTTFPETCAEVQETAIDETGERPSNGTYTLYIEGDETKPWDAYCHDMKRTEPKEFITVSELNNYSQFSGADITETSFRRYRINPITLKIDLLDDTFATTEGDDNVVPDDRDHIPAGWAQFGNGVDFGSATAESRIDLADTPFVFAESVLTDFFCTEADMGGDSSESQITIASDLTFVTLTAKNTISSLTTKTVADCTNLSGTDNTGTTDFTEGNLPLQYAGM